MRIQQTVPEPYEQKFRESGTISTFLQSYAPKVRTRYCAVRSDKQRKNFNVAHMVGNSLRAYPITWISYLIPRDSMIRTLGSPLQPATSALLRRWPRHTLLVSRLERSCFCLQLKGHLDGDDPFPPPTELEYMDRPLSLPDDQEGNLDALRKKLLPVMSMLWLH
jgi:hypothetical protein